jgi:hypothetical protein
MSTEDLPPTAPDDPSADSPALVRDLHASFAGHIKRALDFSVDDSETSLAWVDHYLHTLRGETRRPILEIVAAEAGAYFGEVIRKEIGARWVSDGSDPRRLRLLLEPQFLHFSPIDQAYEVLLGEEIVESDPRLPDGAPLDPDFHPNDSLPSEPAPRAPESAPLPDRQWLAEALKNRPQVTSQEYFSLTGRFETLRLLLELLAQKCASEGREPRKYELADYVSVLAGTEAN